MIVTRVARLTGLEESIETGIIVLEVVLLAVLVGQGDAGYEYWSLADCGGGDWTVGRGVDDAEVGVGGELPKNSDEDAGEDFREL